MADQAEVSKVVAYVATGINNAAHVSKVVAYLLLEPSDTSSDDTVRRSLVTSHVVNKPTR